MQNLDIQPFTTLSVDELRQINGGAISDLPTLLSNLTSNVLSGTSLLLSTAAAITINVLLDAFSDLAKVLD